MSDRSEFMLKALCGAVLLLVIYRLGLAIWHINPLYHVKIPPLPTLSTTNATETAQAKSQPSGSQLKAGPDTGSGKGTRNDENVSVRTTNLVAQSSNAVNTASNLVAQATNTVGTATNILAHVTNSTEQASNVVAQATNSSPRSRRQSSEQRTNAPLELTGAGPAPGLAGMPPGITATPPGAAMPPGMGMPPGMFPGMPPRGRGVGKPGPELPRDIQARIDRVIESEILAPVMRPLPMALLGILGKDVFLRAPNGQTGLVKEGEELGGVKLVRVGINRVLVEEQGEQKELTIFAGLGGEPLLSAQKNGPK